MTFRRVVFFSKKVKLQSYKVESLTNCVLISLLSRLSSGFFWSAPQVLNGFWVSLRHFDAAAHLFNLRGTILDSLYCFHLPVINFLVLMRILSSLGTFSIFILHYDQVNYHWPKLLRKLLWLRLCESLCICRTEMQCSFKVLTRVLICRFFGLVYSGDQKKLAN